MASLQNSLQHPHYWRKQAWWPWTDVTRKVCWRTRSRTRGFTAMLFKGAQKSSPTPNKHQTQPWASAENARSTPTTNYLCVQKHQECKPLCACVPGSVCTRTLTAQIGTYQSGQDARQRVHREERRKAQDWVCRSRSRSSSRQLPLQPGCLCLGEATLRPCCSDFSNQHLLNLCQNSQGKG